MDNNTSHIQSDKPSEQRLLPQNYNPDSKSLTIAHMCAWMCIILDLILMPLVSFSLTLLIWLLFSSEPCHCYGYVNADDTTISNIGICSCFMSSWLESNYKDWGYYNCYSESTKHWHPQFCEGDQYGFWIAIGVINIICYLQHHICFLSLCITFSYSILVVLIWTLTFLCLCVLCIIITIIYCIWYIPNPNADKNPQQYIVYIWNKLSNDLVQFLMEGFSPDKISELIKNLIWNPFAPMPQKKFCVNQTSLIMLARILNFIGACIIISFVIIVPANQSGLNQFNCDKYGLDSRDNTYELRVTHFWYQFLHNNVLLAVLIVYIIFEMFLFFSRRITVGLLRANVPDLDSNEKERIYARMVGYKYKTEINN